MSMHRDEITETLDAAGVEIGSTCSVDSQGGIDHMAPVLDQRWCDHCGQLEITAVLYDEYGRGDVVWMEQVHVYRPQVLVERHAATQGIKHEEIIDTRGEQS